VQSRTASIELPWYVEQRCNSSALVENALYFLQHNNGILEYDLAKNELSVIRLPPICIVSTSIVLMSVEDDGLGFAMMYDDFSLCIWSRVSSTVFLLVSVSVSETVVSGNLRRPRPSLPCALRRS